MLGNQSLPTPSKMPLSPSASASTPDHYRIICQKSLAYQPSSAIHQLWKTPNLSEVCFLHWAIDNRDSLAEGRQWNQHCPLRSPSALRATSLFPASLLGDPLTQGMSQNEDMKTKRNTFDEKARHRGNSVSAPLIESPEEPFIKFPKY